MDLNSHPIAYGIIRNLQSVTNSRGASASHWTNPWPRRHAPLCRSDPNTRPEAGLNGHGRSKSTLPVSNSSLSRVGGRAHAVAACTGCALELCVVGPRRMHRASSGSGLNGTDSGVGGHDRPMRSSHPHTHTPLCVREASLACRGSVARGRAAWRACHRWPGHAAGLLSYQCRLLVS